MDKITFKNGQAPYINDTNLNQMQDNIEKAIEARAVENTKSTLTVNSTYLSNIDINSVTRNGNVCRVDFRAEVIEDISNTTSFLTLPFKPSQSTALTIGIGTQYAIQNIKWGYVSGNQIRSAITKNQYVHIHFTYICG